jgi:hypothetical protein
MWDSPDKAAHYHILDPYILGFISDPALGLLQSKKESLVLYYVS